MALVAAAAAEAKNGREIVLLDMRSLVVYTDHMVVCTGQTPRQTKAIAENIRHVLKHDHGVSVRKVEGDREGEWILLDFIDVVVHVFTPQAREFYRLDRLWHDAPRQEYVAAAS
jgi:ribosome-associated protein